MFTKVRHFLFMLSMQKYVFFQYILILYDKAINLHFFKQL